MKPPIRIAVFLAALSLIMISVACAIRVAHSPETLGGTESLAFGRIVVQLTGPTTRAYSPEMRFFELVEQGSGERYRIDFQAADAPLVLVLPPGDYELSRIMINEGAFQAMANPGPVFQITEGGLNYVGTWEFGVASPTYDRQVAFSVTNEMDNAAQELIERYPEVSGRAVLSKLPEPMEDTTRLYEVDPYPLFWWFRRHHTS